VLSLTFAKDCVDILSRACPALSGAPLRPFDKPLGHEPFGSELKAEGLEAEWLSAQGCSSPQGTLRYVMRRSSYSVPPSAL